MSDLFRLIQAQGEELRSKGDELRSSLRSIKAKFDERLEKIESTSEHHEEAFLSFSTRLDRIENQLAEQNMQHDNNQNLNDSNRNVNNNNQHVQGNDQNVNINNQNDLFNHGLLTNGGGLPARIRLQQNMPQMEDLSVSHAQEQPHQPHQPPHHGSNGNTVKSVIRTSD